MRVHVDSLDPDAGNDKLTLCRPIKLPKHIHYTCRKRKIYLFIFKVHHAIYAYVDEEDPDA